MLGRDSSDPTLFQTVDVESLVPADHKLRKIDAVLDLSFVDEVVAECYADGRGRPSVDPELALRMMLLGVFYDLSDREFCEVIRQCAEAGLVSGRHLSLDGTEIRADASMKSLERWGPSPPDDGPPPPPPDGGGGEPKPASE